jgi:hypothetical protein
MNTNIVSKQNDFAKLIISRRNMIIEVIAALFILLFLYTAVNKTFQIGSTENVLKKTPMFSSFALEAAWGVVVTEYIISIMLFLPYTRKVGLYSSLVLMISFTGYIVYMKTFVSNLPCSCGGVISKLTWNEHLIFNILFTLLALVGILLMQKKFKLESKTDIIPVVFT